MAGNGQMGGGSMGSGRQSFMPRMTGGRGMPFGSGSSSGMRPSGMGGMGYQPMGAQNSGVTWGGQQPTPYQRPQITGQPAEWWREQGFANNPDDYSAQPYYGLPPDGQNSGGQVSGMTGGGQQPYYGPAPSPIISRGPLWGGASPLANPQQPQQRTGGTSSMYLDDQGQEQWGFPQRPPTGGTNTEYAPGTYPTNQGGNPYTNQGPGQGGGGGNPLGQNPATQGQPQGQGGGPGNPANPAPQQNQLWMKDWLAQMGQKDPSLIGQRINVFDPKYGFGFGPNGEWNGPLPDEYRNNSTNRPGGNTFTGMQDGLFRLGGRGEIGQMGSLVGGRLSQDNMNTLGTQGFAGTVSGGDPMGAWNRPWEAGGAAVKPGQTPPPATRPPNPTVGLINNNNPAFQDPRQRRTRNDIIRMRNGWGR